MINILIIIGVVVIVYTFLVYNKLIHLKNLVKEAFSTMDVYLTKRFELIPNLVEIVKGYSLHESETLEKIIKLRSVDYSSNDISKKIEENEKISKEFNPIIATIEKYPELKANETYIELSNNLVDIENEIAKSRKYYNGTVRIYNNKVLMFPSNIFAKLFGYKEEKMFEADKIAKDNIKINI